MDELHFYRGRQGADVAMLTRRLQEVAGKNLQTVATSATIASSGRQDSSREEQKATVARFASSFFGQDIPPTNVVRRTPYGEWPRCQHRKEKQAVRAAVESRPSRPVGRCGEKVTR